MGTNSEPGIGREPPVAGSEPVTGWMPVAGAGLEEARTETLAAIRGVAPPAQVNPISSAGDGDGGAAAGPLRRPALLRLAAPRVVALRPEPVDGGYQSVHAALTRRGARSVARLVGQAVAEALVTFGVIAVLFAGYEIWGTTQIVNAHQADLQRQLDQVWGQPASPAVPGAPLPSTSAGVPLPGGALARLYIPRLGKYWVVVEGVDPADLRLGPGHYPKTALPGQVGNFAVAGHRTPAMFWDLDLMRAGDPIVVEVAHTWYVYRVTEVLITTPWAVEVVAPVPGKPGKKAVSPALTITTCNPKWDNAQRLVVHASLARTVPTSAGRPSELGGA